MFSHLEDSEEEVNVLGFIHFQWAFWSHYRKNYQKGNLMGDILRLEL